MVDTARCQCWEGSSVILECYYGGDKEVSVMEVAHSGGESVWWVFHEELNG